MQLSIGSQWYDTHSGRRNMPKTVEAHCVGSGPVRRIVTVTHEPEYLIVGVLGAWQQRKLNGAWVTLLERRGSAGVNSFGPERRFRPLDETDGS